MCFKTEEYMRGCSLSLGAQKKAFCSNLEN